MRPRCTDHVDPIGYDEEEPEFTGEHGKSTLFQSVKTALEDGTTLYQCMCGHPDYLTCQAECTERDDTRECPRCEELIPLVDFRGNVCGDCADDLLKAL